MRVRPTHLLYYLLAVGILSGLLWQVWPFRTALPQIGKAAVSLEQQEESSELPRAGEPLRPLPRAPSLDPAIVALGHRLFHDPRLSSNGSLSCASCHPPDQGGMDGKRLSPGIDGILGEVNTPGILAASLNFRQNWNGSAATLEDQIDDALTNPRQLSSSWPQVIARLAGDGELKGSFEKLFPDGLTEHNIKRAISDFERSLPQPSRFDRWLRGDHTAISSEEFHGYTVFKQHGCAGCHQGAGVGGNLYQRFGVMANYFKNNESVTKADMGRYNLTGQDEDRHVFKVPGLRNVARTAPYFHDGSSDRLEDAVTRMGRYQLGLELSGEDVAAIVSFLKTLDSEPSP